MRTMFKKQLDKFWVHLSSYLTCVRALKVQNVPVSGGGEQ